MGSDAQTPTGKTLGKRGGGGGGGLGEHVMTEEQRAATLTLIKTLSKREQTLTLIKTLSKREQKVAKQILILY